jgi:hypothetical protein
VAGSNLQMCAGMNFQDPDEDIGEPQFGPANLAGPLQEWVLGVCKHTCWAIAYLLQGPSTMENKTTMHRMHRTHRSQVLLESLFLPGCVCLRLGT